MNFSKTLILFLILVTSSNFAAQAKQTQPCELTARESPRILGLDLGMGWRTLPSNYDLYFPPQNKYTRVKIKGVDKDLLIGETWYSWLHNLHEPRAALDGMKTFHISFFNNKLYDISITYDKASPKSKEIAESVERWSENHKLPSNAWNPVSGDNRTLACRGFTLKVGPEFIELMDVDIQKEIETAANNAVEDEKGVAEGATGTITHKHGGMFYADLERKTSIGLLYQGATFQLLDTKVYKDKFKRDVIKVKVITNKVSPYLPDRPPTGIGQVGWTELEGTSFEGKIRTQ